MIINKCWRNEEIIGILKNTSFLQIYNNAYWWKNGFIKETQLTFKACSITGDYHDK